MSVSKEGKKILGRSQPTEKEKGMARRYCILVMAFVLFQSGIALAQDYPIMNMIADRVIQRYQQSSCQDLWEKKGKPKSAQEKRVVELLRADPQMRQAFLDKVAPPIANKMFECGMLP